MVEEYVEWCMQGRHVRTGISRFFCNCHPLDGSSLREWVSEIERQTEDILH